MEKEGKRVLVEQLNECSARAYRRSVFIAADAGNNGVGTQLDLASCFVDTPVHRHFGFWNVMDPSPFHGVGVPTRLSALPE